MGRTSTAGTNGSERYDAFLSYSHKLDQELAKRLQPELERFAKPWHRIRALRVFRDDVSLSANPDLWGSIEEALGASRWLVLLASPGTGESEWVNREVGWWLDNKPDPLQHLLIAVTDGSVPWDSGGPASGAVSIIPPALKSQVVTEPRWVDLRGLRIPGATGDYRTGLQDAVANLAAPIWGRPKDFLYGQAVRQHRRAMRIARLAVAVMAALTLTAAGGGLFAYVQRNQAVAQARLANSRQLVAESSAIEASNPGLARQLLAVADRLDPTPQVTGALMNSLSIAGELDFNGSVRAEAYMPDRPVLAVATDNGVNLVDTATGRPLASLPSSTGYVSAVAFTPDSRAMATGGADGDVRLWDVTEPSRPRLIGTLRASLGIVDTLSFGPGGDIVAAAYDNQVAVLWDVRNPAEPVSLAEIRAGNGSIGVAAAISPDGRVLAASGTATDVQLWDIANPKHPAKLAALAGSSSDALAFSPDGHLLASGDTSDYNVRIWDVTDPVHPQLRPELSGHGETVDALAFSSDGRLLATGSLDETAKIWNLADPTHPSIITTLPGHAAFVTAVAFSPDGQTLAGGSDDGSVFLWNVADPGSSVPLGAFPDSAGPVAFSPDDRLAVTASPPELWNISDPAAPRLLTALAPPNAPVAEGVQALAISPSGQLLAMNDVSGNTLIWDIRRPSRPRLITTIGGSSGSPAEELVFSSGGKNLVIPGVSSPQIWNIHSPFHPGLLPAPRTKFPKGVNPSFDGSYVTAADLIALWQAMSPGNTASIMNWVTHNRHASIIGASPQTGLLVTAAGTSQQLSLSESQQLDLWRVSTPAHPLASLTSSIGGLTTAAISPDGTRLAAASDTGVSIWDLSDPAHPATLTTLNFGSEPGAPYLAFSSNGNYLAVAGYGSSVQLWEMDIPGILNRLCAESGHAITAAQWNQYVPGVAYSRPCRPDDYLPAQGPESSQPEPLPPAPVIRVPVISLHNVNWENTPVPGQFCSAQGLVKIRNGAGWGSSSKWGRVQFYVSSPVLYGDLQGKGTQDAAVQVWCDNGGGTADGQIAEAYLIFSLHDKVLKLIGTVTPQEQPPNAAHVSMFASIRISPGSVVAHEDWYRTSDATCCPTGKATTVWAYTNGRLIPGAPDITS